MEELKLTTVRKSKNINSSNAGKRVIEPDVKTLNEEEENILSFLMTVDIVRFLFLTSILFFGLSGLLYLTVGIMYIYNSQSMVETVLQSRIHNVMSEVFASDFKPIGIFFLALGVSICLVFVTLFYTTCISSRASTIVFLYGIFIITLLQICFTLAIQYPPLFKGNTVAVLRQHSMTSFNQDIQASDDTIQMPIPIHIMTAFHLNFNCCGIYSPNEYINMDKEQKNVVWEDGFKPSEVPLSCCSTKYAIDDVRIVVHGDFEDMKSCMNGEEEYYNHEGCFTKLDDAVMTIRRRLLASECVLSCFNIYAIALGAFHMWAINVKKYIF